MLRNMVNVYILKNTPQGLVIAQAGQMSAVQERSGQERLALLQDDRLGHVRHACNSETDLVRNLLAAEGAT